MLDTKLASWSCGLIVAAVAVLAVPSLRADTVYLKNGAWIDGRVRSRTEKVVEVEIGRIGKIEIQVSEVYEIEKNNRTGEESRPGSKEEEERIAKLTREGKIPPVKPKEDSSGEGESSRPAGSKTAGDGPPDATESKAAEEPADKDASTPGAPERDVPPIDPQLKARIEDLVRDLERQKAQFRSRAERHLKAIGAPALPYLLPVAKSPSELARVSAFRLFSEFGDDTVVEPCIEALADPNEYVREQANKTLERVTQKSFGYQAQASPRRRENAQQKWKKWWEEEQRELEKTRALAGKSSRGES